MTFYITTPIYYVNDVPHIGTAYSTIVADVLSRYHRLFGESTLFLTGTDEHGQKVQSAARGRGLDPQQHVDEMVTNFQEVWKELQISNDIFIRTTYPYHKSAVALALQQLFDSGDIYQHEYEGWYSVGDEIFYTDKDLVDGKAPTGKEVQRVVERNYFFRMSKYQQRLLDYIEQHPEFIQPEGKRSETLGFLRQPLEDLCISRPKSRLSWGIELPFDREYVTYVWFDALLNYISAVGFGQEGERAAQFSQWWPAAHHLIGKDILVPHTIYWPTMLMALGLPLPRTIFAHGWILNAMSKKMSKSEGPVLRPLDLKALVGVDAFRYFLIREIPLGNDAPCSEELVISRVNAELANNLGNLLSRSTNLVVKYFEGKIPARSSNHPETSVLAATAAAAADKVKGEIEALRPHGALEQIVSVLNATNRYIDQLAPWKSAKSDLALAGEALYTALESLRIAASLLYPVMPSKMSALLTQIGWTTAPTLADARQWGLLQSGTAIGKAEPLFPRVELPKPAAA